MSTDIVSVSRLLNPERVVLAKLFHAGDGSLDIPLLVGVHHQSSFFTDFFSDPSSSFHVVFDFLRSNLHLKVLEAFVDELLAEETGVFLSVSEPSSTGGISRVTILLKILHALLPSRTDLLENSKAFLRSDAVGHVSEVNILNELLGFEAADEFPEGLLGLTGPHVPEGVHDGVDSQADDSFLGSEPAQLTVLSKSAHKFDRVGLEIFDKILTNDKELKGLDHSSDDLVTSSASEGESVTNKVAVGVEDDVNTRIVRLLVHGIRSIQFQ